MIGRQAKSVKNERTFIKQWPWNEFKTWSTQTHCSEHFFRARRQKALPHRGEKEQQASPLGSLHVGRNKVAVGREANVLWGRLTHRLRQNHLVGRQREEKHERDEPDEDSEVAEHLRKGVPHFPEVAEGQHMQNDDEHKAAEEGGWNELEGGVSLQQRRIINVSNEANDEHVPRQIFHEDHHHMQHEDCEDRVSDDALGEDSVFFHEFCQVVQTDGEAEDAADSNKKHG